MDVNALKNRVRRYRKAEGLSKNELAARAGFEWESTLRLLDDEAWNPTTKTLEALLAVIPADWVPPDEQIIAAE